MRKSEKGLALIELVLSVAVFCVTATIAGAFIFQVNKATELSNSHVAAIWQAQKSGDWISRDAQRADSIIVDDLEYPTFLVLTWTQRNFEPGGHSIYHVVSYSFIDMTGNTGKLNRNHWSSEGMDENTLIASYIYQNSGDTDNTSKAIYVNPTLTVQLSFSLGNSWEKKQYIVERRPSFEY